MRQNSLNPSRASVVGIYAVGVLLILTPPFDLLTNVWPLDLGNIQWRYGFLGLLSAYLQTPLLGVLICMGVAWWQGHATAIKLVSIVSLVAALGLMVAMGIFALDIVQLRPQTPPERLSSFQAGAIIAELKHGAATIVYALLAFGGLKTPKTRASAGVADEGPKIVVGHKSAE